MPLSFFKYTRIGRSKFLIPLSNRFIGDRDTSVGKQLFDLSETEAEPMAQLDGVTADFRGKTVTLVAGSLVFHAAQSAKPELN